MSESDPPSPQALDEIQLAIRGALLTADVGPFPEEAETAFRDVAVPLLTKMGLDCELIELFSVAKRCTSNTINGRRVIVFDHNLLACFERLDWILLSELPEIAATSVLLRLFAESVRSASPMEPTLYAFFIRGARDAERILRGRSHDTSRLSRFWQSVLLLCHEGAHIIPAEHELHIELVATAKASANAMAHRLISVLTGRGSQGLPASAEGHLERWLSWKVEQNLDDKDIEDAYMGLAVDPRFLGELACDRFAVLGLKSALLSLQRLPEDQRAHIISEALTAAFRGFLHLRLVRYLDELLQSLPSHRSVQHISALRMTLLTEISFRRHLFVEELLDLGNEFGDAEWVGALRQRFEALQELHSAQLFELAGDLAERSVFDPSFQTTLLEQLAADGLNLDSIAEDELWACLDHDRIWRSVVA